MGKQCNENRNLWENWDESRKLWESCMMRARNHGETVGGEQKSIGMLRDEIRNQRESCGKNAASYVKAGRAGKNRKKELVGSYTTATGT